MTEEAKSRILSLRAEGKSYKEIYKETGTPLGTVKSICSRSKAEERRCRQCGKALHMTPGRRRKEFCCDACRWKWHREHAKPVEARCPVCGGEFEIKGHPKQKYCCRECYRKARYGKADR